MSNREDDLILDDVEFDVPEVKVNESDILKSVSANLTSDEIKEIEENKKKYQQKKKEEDNSKQKKKTIEEELEYSKTDLDDDELKISTELQNELVGFIKDKADIVPSSGVKFLLPTGIDLLDTIAGGGFAAGALTLIVGNPGTFKSALLCQVIATNQRKYRGKVLNVYMDSEEAMTQQRLQNLGVTNPPIKPYPARSVEDVFKTIETVCAFKELKNLQDNPTIIAWDSVANTITSKEKETTELDINKFLGLKARIISVLLPKYIAKLEDYNIGLIVVNQLREKIDMGYFPSANDLRWLGDKTMPGGNSLKFNAFHLLLLKVKGDLKADEWGFHGVMLEAKFAKNKLFQPNIPIQLIVDFNKGISNFWTNWQLLVEHKRATASAWCSLKSAPHIKFRKREAFDKYSSDPEFRNEFDNQVKQVLKTEYIDKYTNSLTQDNSTEKDTDSLPEQK